MKKLFLSIILAISSNAYAADAFNTSDTTTAVTSGASIAAAAASGTWTTPTSWTLPAWTANGTISGGGNQLNNIIIGATTPLAGSFTSMNASGLVAIGSATNKLRAYTADAGGALTTGLIGLDSYNGTAFNTALEMQFKGYQFRRSNDAVALTILDTGVVKIETGGSANAAVCWKADAKSLGYCSSVVAAGGTCTCN